MFRLGLRLCGKPSKYQLKNSSTFLVPDNASYLENLAEEDKNSPNSDSTTLVQLLRELSFSSNDLPLIPSKPATTPQNVDHDASSTPHTEALTETSKLAWLCRAWQMHGHRTVMSDPLCQSESLFRLPKLSTREVEELQPNLIGFTSQNLDQSFPLNLSAIKQIGLPPIQTLPTLRVLYDRLKTIYGGEIGYEFMHLPDPACRTWLHDRIQSSGENSESSPFTKDEKTEILTHLMWGGLFEHFLHTKFTGIKRFGLDGGEALIPGIMEMIVRSSRHGVEHIFMGMAHRGRLSILVNICGKPFEMLFNEFKGVSEKEEQGGASGDVKYHLGSSMEKKLKNGRSIQVTLLDNASHLESVNPIVEGFTRATQHYLGDDGKKRALVIQLHGDASFTGQGVCYETMNLSELSSFTTGGTLHVVINNQIGFTADPKNLRSSAYCTDLGLAFDCPVFHVNGDSPEAVVRAFRLATDFRNTFHKSAIVDFVCYRRYGHNEADEPMFTQPLMYRTIKTHPIIYTRYAEQKIQEGSVTRAVVEEIKERFTARLRQAFKDMESYKYEKSEWYGGYWKKLKKPMFNRADFRSTNITEELYHNLANAVVKVPPHMPLDFRLSEALETQKKKLESGVNLGWSETEIIALGSLHHENIHIRLSGRNVSHGNVQPRNVILYDQFTDQPFHPLSVLSNEKFQICDHVQGNFSTLGFELGYSMVNPYALIIWEIAEGALIDSAQVIVDQFFCAGEAKWGKPLNLIISLCHSCEHENSDFMGTRIERFLQATNEEIAPHSDGYCEQSHAKINLEIFVPTTPANYFHLLRRHVHRNFRKPSVFILPKHDQEFCDKEDLVKLNFNPIITDDSSKADIEVHRVLFCSGQVCYKLRRKLHGRANRGTVLIRIEQLAPWPDILIQKELNRFPNANIAWCQEEPQNMGAWSYVRPRLEVALRNRKRRLKTSSDKLYFIGRSPSFSPLIKNNKFFLEEEEELLKSAITTL